MNGLPAPGPFGLAAGSWDTLRGLLDEALALAPNQREAWLQRLALQQAPLVAPLRALLAHQEHSDLAGALDTLPKLDDAAPASPSRGAPCAGAGVGPYRLLRPLGEGGMASVWLAERTDLLQGRQVALKLPHGSWRRAGLAERLARERDILATLEHPHIARLYDAGVTADGQPYLALEYVQGQPLDQHVQQRHLALRPRLDLLLQVCDAVAHAHARLVVHRDLKPANILVDAAGQVKLLDFGIAKLMQGDTTAATPLTQELGQALTPDYAAPEQIQGLPLGTAADVYALGVLLFELLTGQRPYRLAGRGRAQLEQARQQARVPAPSAVVADPALRRALRGDLDTIVAHAMQARPQDRYASVSALADDLRRHLQHQPLLARPESRGRRLRKFVLRHRLGVTAATAVVLALLVGSTAALWQAGQARQQRDAALLAKARADSEASAARSAEREAEAQADLSSFLLTDLSSARPGQDMLDQLDRAEVMVRGQYRHQPALRARMLLSLAQSYRWVSHHERANALLAEAEPLLQAPAQRGTLALLQCMRATALARQGRIDAAQALMVRATALSELAGPGAAVPQVECLLEAAWVQRFAGAPQRAVALVQQALKRIDDTGRADSELASEAINALARAQMETGQHADAVATSRRSIELLQRLGRVHSPGLRNAWGVQAKALREGGQPLLALQAHGGNGAFNPAQADLPVPVRYDHAVTLAAAGRHVQALALLGSVRAQTRATGDDNMGRFVVLAQARSQAALGRHQAAQRTLAEAQRLFQPLQSPPNGRLRTYLLAQADLALDQGRPQQAAAWLAQARQLLQQRLSADDPAWRWLHQGEGRLALQRGDASAALASAQAALAQAQREAIQPDTSLWVAEALWLRAQARQALGQTAGAREDTAAAQRLALATAGAEHPLARLRTPAN